MLHQFEQDLFPRLLPDDYIRRIDIFQHFAPQFLLDANAAEVVRVDWENRAEDRKVEPIAGQAFDQAFCQKACEEWDICWVWQWSESGECLIGDNLRIGARRSGFVSGWRLDRLRRFRSTQSCENRPMAYV